MIVEAPKSLGWRDVVNVLATILRAHIIPPGCARGCPFYTICPNFSEESHMCTYGLANRTFCREYCARAEFKT
jgi:hypothetical protein